MVAIKSHHGELLESSNFYGGTSGTWGLGGANVLHGKLQFKEGKVYKQKSLSFKTLIGQAFFV